MNNKDILSALNASADDKAVNAVVGMVVLKDELLNQVSGGAWSSGYICTLSGECGGGNCRLPRLPMPWE